MQESIAILTPYPEPRVEDIEASDWPTKLVTSYITTFRQRQYTRIKRGHRIVVVDGENDLWRGRISLLLHEFAIPCLLSCYWYRNLQISVKELPGSEVGLNNYRQS